MKAKPVLWRHLLEERGKASLLIRGFGNPAEVCLGSQDYLGFTLTDAIKSLHPGTAGDRAG